LRGALHRAEGCGGVAVEVEAERLVGHEAVDPGAGGGVNAKAGEGVNGKGQVEVVKEAGDIKEEDGADPPCSDGLFCFMTKGCGRIWRRVMSA